MTTTGVVVVTPKQTRTISRSPKDLPTYDEIAARAHEIFLSRGGSHGCDIDDWLQAEAEVGLRK